MAWTWRTTPASVSLIKVKWSMVAVDMVFSAVLRCTRYGDDTRPIGCKWWIYSVRETFDITPVPRSASVFHYY